MDLPHEQLSGLIVAAACSETIEEIEFVRFGGMTSCGTSSCSASSRRTTSSPSAKPPTLRPADLRRA